MKQKMNITVIVPVYNVEQYLERCVDSILKQSYPVAKILLVDDGSTDGSDKLCECLANEHASVQVIHKENAGLGFARNTGLDNLSSDTTHIMFVDSDDWLEADMIGTYVRAIEDNKADCVLGGFTKRDNKGNSLFELRIEDNVWSADGLTQGLIPRVCGSVPHASDSIPMSVCSCLFSREIIDDYSLRFPSEREVISEDFVFKFEYLSACRRVVTTSCVGYSYRANHSSLTTTFRPDRFEKSMYFYNYALKLVSDYSTAVECSLRLKKTLFIYIAVCIEQEVPRVSGKSRREAREAIRAMTSDQRLQTAIGEYPYKNLGLKQRIFVELLRRNAAGILFEMAERGFI